MATHLLHTLTLSILNTDDCQLDAAWQYDNVNSPFSRLYLIHSGAGWVHHHGRQWPLRPGGMHLIPSFTLSHYRCDEHIEISYVHFIDRLQGGLSMYDVLPFHYERANVGRPAFRLMKRLIELNPNRQLIENNPARYDKHDLMPPLDDSDLEQDPASLIEGHGILLQLLARFIGEPDDADHRRRRGQHQFREVTHYIDQHLDRPMSLKELADLVYLAPDYFSRRFAQVMGVRPIEYINRRRIEKAQWLLATTHASIRQVARQVGLANLPYFHRVFLKYTHTTPGNYHRAHRPGGRDRRGPS